MDYVMNKTEQIRQIRNLLGHIKVPAGDGYPEIDMVFMGPVARIAEWMYDQGLRYDPV